MAIKFHMPDGTEVDMVILAVKFFPVATGEQFRDLLVAISESPSGAPKPTKLDQFSASHPAFPASFGSAPTPNSFAEHEYHGIHPFISADKAAPGRGGRSVMPRKSSVTLTAEEPPRNPPIFFVEALPQPTAKKRVVSHLKAQFAAPGAQPQDPSQPGPADRKV